jgi:hypothetical protein
MGRQAKAAEHVTSLRSDYFFGLKDDAGLLAMRKVPDLFGESLERCRDEFIVDTFEGEVTKERGRIESRTATVIRLDPLNPCRDEKAKLANAQERHFAAKRWPVLKSVLMAERRHESASGKLSSTDVRYFISGLALSA